MKKLKLQIETLRVEQFQANPNPAAARGTVRGFETDVYNTCVWRLCADVPETQYLGATDCC